MLHTVLSVCAFLVEKKVSLNLNSFLLLKLLIVHLLPFDFFIFPTSAGSMLLSKKFGISTKISMLEASLDFYALFVCLYPQSSQIFHDFINLTKTPPENARFWCSMWSLSSILENLVRQEQMTTLYKYNFLFPFKNFPDQNPTSFLVCLV